VIEFGEWLPDRPDLDNALTRCEGVYHSGEGYRPFRGLSDPAGSSPPFASSQITGHYSDETYVYSATRTDIFMSTQSNGDTVIRSRAAGYSTALSSSNFRQWSFTRFRDQVIAARAFVEPQVGTAGATSAFTDLGGTPPEAHYVATVGDFVVLGYIYGPGVLEENRIQWSGFDDETQWTPGTNQSDFQDLSDTGIIEQIVGGDYGLIFTTKGIWRMDYVGLPSVFKFDRIIDSPRLKGPKTLVKHGRSVYGIFDTGFYEIVDGSQLIPIGEGKVNNFYFENADSFGTTSAAIDDARNLVCWAYSTSDSLALDKMLIFNYVTRQWSYVDLMGLPAPFNDRTVDQIFAAEEPVFTGDQGERKSRLYALDGQNNNYYAFQGVRQQNIVFETGEMGGTKLSTVSEIWPYIELTSATSSGNSPHITTC
jgi:hypothetical protein